ncbi:unnamed protein product [Haemonchus placei]|uniref:BED-type domain-containing protein n=1 Tax=Haemonchus placei TaxID=6290 RepID=A0A158QQW2_HAEPC|nr:unnamed protein product [Haemonchus placei]
MLQLPQPGSFSSFPSAFAAFASQLQSPHFQSLLQSQVAALQSQHIAALQTAAGTTSSESKPRVNSDYVMPRKRVGGSTMKTAKVWRFFDELPTPEQAAECRLCRKKIKATNSSFLPNVGAVGIPVSSSSYLQEPCLAQPATAWLAACGLRATTVSSVANGFQAIFDVDDAIDVHMLRNVKARLVLSWVCCEFSCIHAHPCDHFVQSGSEEEEEAAAAAAVSMAAADDGRLSDYPKWSRTTGSTATTTNITSR